MGATTLDKVCEAIAALKDRKGSSVIAINKWIEMEKKVRRKSLYREKPQVEVNVFFSENSVSSLGVRAPYLDEFLHSRDSSYTS